MTRHPKIINDHDADHWRARDLDVLWHPCTQMREHPHALPLLPVAYGKGAWLVGHDGRRTLDAVSSWWTNIHGHSEPRIAEAIGRQARTLEQVILAGFSHAPAVELAERLLAVAPRQPDRAPLAKVFYADNGSAGVEVALKMAFHWYRNRGDEPNRTKFVALTNSYHGETVGALSVGDIPLYRRVYAPLLLDVLFAPSPDAFGARTPADASQCAEDAADALARLLDEHPGEVCALILEPRLQCAGGMRMHDPVYLKRVRDLCDVHGVFLIADEIATGFGRTGTLFAFEQAGVMPDLMCVSKGLTGGFLPLAAVLATQQIYEGFLDDSRERAFLHSHSYSGNPLACAAALASLDILEGDDVIARNRVTAQKMGELASSFAANPLVAEVRQAGMVVAIELHPEPENHDDGHAVEIAGRRGLRMYRTALDHGVLLRPLGDVLYWMPPYCVDDAQLAQIADATDACLKEAARCA
ncbi:adenosylmethionine--8-amino-7-oxononanoate transaminase [Lysobacter brunescens]|uniref:Adenosylmethionine-8-amino-7-oxononanoate aminotransferase n=1 Tax=Lysobacter brunescens TaxID=262323 RepID=A0ABW2YFZ1_9GAMM